MSQIIVKERPILMSGPSIQPLLEGRKTQTRRIVKLPRTRDAFVMLDHGNGWWPYQSDDGESEICDDGNEYPYNCPYGKPGDKLWVKETWAIGVSTGNSWHSENAPLSAISQPEQYGRRYMADGDQGFYGRWRPLIFMPRWASRILLEIADVRVERLNEISEEDAKAEGCVAIEGMKWHTFEEADDGIPMHPHTAIDAYAGLWESINGEGSWDANPFVWVIQFRRIEG